MKKGTIFDLKEFAVYDGPGLRQTVFLKGCPLRCNWCHNPEGLSFSQEVLRGSNGCIHCGACEAVCPSPDHCILCGKCIRACPKNLRRFAARELSSRELADILLKNRAFLAENGGVTFSGGEPLAQPGFLFETMDFLKPLHLAVETSGHVPEEVFREMLGRVDLVMMDIKHADSEVHREYAGVSNDRILANLALLKESGRPFIIRIPVIPQVNDSVENMERTAALLRGAGSLERLELLRYHQTAGAKYELLGKEYPFRYTRETPSLEPFARVFEENGIPVFIP